MNKIKVLILILAAFIGLGSYAATSSPYIKISAETPQSTTAKVYTPVSALTVVAKPAFYLNKNIKIRAKFDKFSTLGLDYKPAMKSSETYISFLIQREDIKDHNVPLSEMKIFIKRTDADKYIELSSGDEVEFSGKVFSTALGDPWIEVENFVVISSKSNKIKATAK